MFTPRSPLLKTRSPNLLHKVANQLDLRFDEEGWATVRKPSSQIYGLLTQLLLDIKMRATKQNK